MIQQVLAQVAKNIKENAPYLSRVGGYAWPQSIRIQDRVKVLPACEGENGPEWMIPETAESAVVFFESNEAALEYQSISTMIFRANVRLIVWLNTSRLSGSTAQVEQDIINALHEEPTETFPASRIVCKIVSRLSGPGIFTRYTFDEAENQQLMPPFQYFAYNLNVNFAIAPACATSTVIQTAPQC